MLKMNLKEKALFLVFFTTLLVMIYSHWQAPKRPNFFNVKAILLEKKMVTDYRDQNKLSRIVTFQLIDYERNSKFIAIADEDLYLNAPLNTELLVRWDINGIHELTIADKKNGNQQPL